MPSRAASWVSSIERVAAAKTSDCCGVCVIIVSPSVGVAVTTGIFGSGVPVVKAIAVATSICAVAVAALPGVGVLVTTRAVGVFVANIMFSGVSVGVPVVCAWRVCWAERVAAAKRLSGVGVAVTTHAVGVLDPAC